MAVTAAKITSTILKALLVQGSETDLEPDEYADVIFSMNNFMLALDADGVTLGYTEVTDLGDEITIPAGAMRGLIGNVALDVAPMFKGVVSDQLRKMAREGLKVMEKLGTAAIRSAYPDNLPIGSGNTGNYGYTTSAFYPDMEEEILAEISGPIGLESGTESAAT